MPTHTPTDDDLRGAYACAQWAEEGITFETAMTTPMLRAALVRLRNNQRRFAKNARLIGSRHIEHTQGDDQ